MGDDSWERANSRECFVSAWSGSFLRALCRNIAHAVYRPDPDTFLRRMKPEDLGLDASDLNVAANFGSSVYSMRGSV